MTRRRVCDPLQTIPNVGPRTAACLRRPGIRVPADLRGRDGDALYRALCRRDGVRHDICLRDVFVAAVDFAAGKPTRPWWEYSRRRKARKA